ncbi:hypothetical protein [Enterococcus sp. LJL51]|uniref:hypothetical protein n=1 Tax=Enterococcus sp. LJL51 TaxID=3416656 RepID=UPI003CE985D0
MSNLIILSENQAESIQLSNGLTAVLLTTFGLSAFSLAETAAKKGLTISILENDQSCIGLGTILLKLSGLSWIEQSFEEDKRFLLQAVTSIKKRIGWKSLDYCPSEELLFPVVNQLIALLEELTIEQITWLSFEEESALSAAAYPTCPYHGLLLSIYGCHACNDQ